MQLEVVGREGCVLASGLVDERPTAVSCVCIAGSEGPSHVHLRLG